MLDQVIRTFLSSLNLPAGTPLAVGVSGGVDSLTLAVCLSHACAGTYPLTAFIVDHGLRSVSAQEARQTKEHLAEWGIPADILVWRGKKPTTRVEEMAREKRYELLQKACEHQGIHYLFLAHHAGDQAETFLSRLSHASALEGLKGMQEISRRPSVFLCRPFLKVPKADIVRTAKTFRLTWAEDEMNQDERYERVRWRRLLPRLASYGLTVHNITTSMARLSLAEEALRFYKDAFVRQNVILHPLGYLVVPEKAYRGLPLAVQIKFLQWAIERIGQQPQTFSFTALEQKARTLKGPLGGCRFCVKQGKVYVAKEASKMPGPLELPPKKWVVWDRFKVWSAPGGTIQAGMPKVGAFKDLPAMVLETLPVVKNKKGLEIPVTFHYNKEEKNACICFNLLQEGQNDEF